MMSLHANKMSKMISIDQRKKRLKKIQTHLFNLLADLNAEIASVRGDSKIRCETGHSRRTTLQMQILFEYFCCCCFSFDALMLLNSLLRRERYMNLNQFEEINGQFDSSWANSRVQRSTMYINVAQISITTILFSVRCTHTF